MSAEKERQIKVYFARLAQDAGPPHPFSQVKRRAHSSTRRRHVALAAVTASTVLAVGLGVSRWSPSQDTKVSVIGPATGEVSTTSTTALPTTDSVTAITPVPTTLLMPDDPFGEPGKQMPWVIPDYEMTSVGLPASFVVITVDGEIRRIDTDSGDVVTSFGVIPLGTDEEYDVTQARLRTVPGTNDILVAMCCEPVGGNIYTVNEPFLFEDLSPSYVGTRVAPSPDGSMVATGLPAYGVLVTRLSPPGSPEELVTGIQDSVEVAWDPRQAAVIWTPTATALSPTFFVLEEEKLVVGRTALERYSGGAIDLQINYDLSLFNRSLATRADGKAVIAGCPTTECLTTLLVEVDLELSMLRVMAELDYVAKLGGFDPAGLALLATDTSGNVHLLSEDDDVIVATDVHWASW